MTDPFVPHAPYTPIAEPEPGSGPLARMRLAVKDLFDVAGLPTGAGNPRWLETHEVPTVDAEAVARLRRAGATIVGKTVTDELAWSLNGSNPHYGTPENPAAPGRLPGGSSSGSASAVALGLADIGLGTDTGGSIRLPASYCGLYGLRPTHGRVPLDGAVPLAPTYDTAGVLTRDAATLRAAMRVLFGGDLREADGAPVRITRLLVPADVWDEQSPAAREALTPAIERLGLPIDRAPLFDEPGALEQGRIAYTTLQAYEAERIHRAWVEREGPVLGAGVGARFAGAADLTQIDRDRALRRRELVTARLLERLSGGAALVIPAAPGPAPAPSGPIDREAIVRLTCLCGHSGAPGLAIPGGEIDGLPIGLQLVAAPGRDESLLELALGA